MNWRNIMSNIGAIYIFAETVYPGLSPDMIWSAIETGAIIPAAFKLFVMYCLVMAGREPVRISYVTPEKQ